jgi:hypothetical protein
MFFWTTVVLVMMFTAAVQAQFRFTIVNGVYEITSYYGSASSLTIPNTGGDGAPMAYIGEQAFAHNSTLTNITMDAIWSIQANAFAYCSNLTSVYFLGNAPAVDPTAFTGDDNTTIYYLPGATGWGTNFAMRPAVVWIPPLEMQFVYITNNGAITITGTTCLIPSVSIPSTITGMPVTSIGDGALAYCARMTNVVIPSGVMNIGTNPFNSCPNLVSIDVDRDNPAYMSADGVLFNKDQTTLVAYPLAKTAGGYAIPTSVTNIGAAAFVGCFNLTNITIPDGVTSIGSQAFSWCQGLTGVYFKGNAPPPDWAVFFNDNNATIYYLPGTSGWGSTLDGRPTVLWNPKIQIEDGFFGVRTNQFGFNVTGTSNIVFVVEASTDPSAPIWSPLGTNTITEGSLYFSDPQWAKYSERFYRLRTP